MSYFTSYCNLTCTTQTVIMLSRQNSWSELEKVANEPHVAVIVVVVVEFSNLLHSYHIPAYPGRALLSLILCLMSDPILQLGCWMQWSWINYFWYTVYSPQEKSCCALLSAAVAPSPACRNWWNIWGIITNPTYSSCELVFISLSLHSQVTSCVVISENVLSNAMLPLFLKVWELPHKVAILPWPPDSPAHLFQSATRQNEVHWTCAPSACCCNQPKHDSCGHGSEAPTVGLCV